MSTRLQAELVRRIVRTAFQQHGADERATLCETMLIRGGFFCGRRFTMDGLAAIWFTEENQLKLYDRAGEVVEVMSPREEAVRCAA